MGTTRLDRAQVAEVALRLLNEVGLEALSLRRIAKELNVQAPALYWHFKSKQALLDEMATLMTARLTEEAPAPSPGESWQESLTGVARLLRRGLLAYRDGAKVYSGTRLTSTGHARRQEEFLRKLVDSGFTPSAAARAFSIVFTFTLGFVTEEQAVHPMPGERAPGYDVEERRAALAADHPLAAQVSADLFGDYEARFEEGLAAVVAGVGATLR
ncbi:TetR/AcrR family transcriptional regulator C-terminal domain-containing protein [Streptomyces sp. NPDC054796]|uniref:TetR/AcrR family transcriptional regulator C-terminal domain-containing protein n=1 Tax=Streptomyces daliensis TaxID=299421 RepID=A0A8T4INM2_9ACTN|nr:TetR/AcrR family transcriptional regulator C-terminal domain-containing protein [Streptomyces daliensis]